MANEQNLIPIRDSEVARELQEKSVKKRHENTKRRKTLKEELTILLETAEEGTTNQEKMSVALFKQALKGNTKAFEIIRDTIGEKPKDQVENLNIETTYEDYINKVVDEDEY